MKSIANSFVAFKAGHLGFALVCVTLLSAGAYATVVLDRFGHQQDEFSDSFNHPSALYLAWEAKQEKPNGPVPAPAATEPARPAEVWPEQRPSPEQTPVP